MARPAPIRLAGMIAATATFALAATEATAQTTTVCAAQTGATCTSTQTMTGEVTGTVNLDVAVGQLQVTNDASGNLLVGGIDQAAAALAARQTMTGPSVTARTAVDAPTAHVENGGAVATTAVANSVALGGPSASITGTVDQSAQTTVLAETVADVQYIPAPADFSAQAVANAVQTSTTGASHQDLTIRQTNAPSTIEARTDVYVDNAWNLAARANARANQTVLYNAGGSLVAATDQTNQGRVRAVAQAQTYVQGQTTVAARAVANEVIAGNQDIYLELNNTQLNTGGVEATATYTGVSGYDAYVGAEAVGNSVTGYACSQCGGEVNVTNTQTNDANVTATTTATIGAGRTAVVGATAVGNSATFYVSRPGG
ncbi:holdfast anchor protein HfaD [Brevundimonas sp. SL130]|uniref:holdfast anchor protein HfaD n=1 Tax=Brevundimonas sp. SL130 TaxID=2995143 RepID=UPI00226CD5A3|nr:holdfast anchor protein HfaD [Brevundimonas sp. SL130]WAC60927.1 holdfast anchor protein HfaD [Brevundimonas sp. SL130]